jgi:hypothetical protein
MTTKEFDKSILIAAHPDDEILWFSSLLDAVDEVLIAFLECSSQPLWTTGRKKSLSEYPMQNVLCLGIPESEVFADNNWHEPVITKFGIKISDNDLPARKYTQNYWELKRKLESKLQRYDNENMAMRNMCNYTELLDNSKRNCTLNYGFLIIAATNRST